MADEFEGTTPDTSNAAPEAPADLYSQMESAIANAPELFPASESASDAPVEATTEAAEPTGDAPTEEADQDLWAYLQSLEPEDKSEPQATTIDQLEAALAKDPAALAQFQALAKEQSELGQQWQELQERAGSQEAVAMAVNVFSALNRGFEPNDKGLNGYTEAALQLFEHNPSTFMQTTGSFMNLAMSQPETRDSIVEFVMQSVGLNPEFLNDYKNVTLDGGYRPVVDTAGKMAVLENVEKLRTEREKGFDYNKAFQRLPEKMQFQILENPDDAETAKWYLDKEARDILAEQRDLEAKQQREQQYAEQLNYDSSKESNTLMIGAVTDHLQTMLSRGIPEGVAKAAMFDVLMNAWEGYFTENSPYAKTEAAIIEAYKKGDKQAVAGGKKQYFDMFQGLLQTNLKKISTKGMQLPKKVVTRPKGALPAGQFDADRNPQNPMSGLSLHEQMQAAIGQ